MLPLNYQTTFLNPCQKPKPLNTGNPRNHFGAEIANGDVTIPKTEYQIAHDRASFLSGPKVQKLMEQGGWIRNGVYRDRDLEGCNSVCFLRLWLKLIRLLSQNLGTQDVIKALLRLLAVISYLAQNEQG